MASFTCDRVKNDPARPVRSLSGNTVAVPFGPAFNTVKTTLPSAQPIFTTFPKTP